MSLPILGRWPNPPGRPPVVVDPDPDPDTPDPEPLALKPAITGIGPRSAGAIFGREADLGFVVADIHWGLIQPEEGGEIDTRLTTGALGWSQIDKAQKSGLPYRVRIHAGDEAPDWAKQLGGGAMFLVITERKPGDTTPAGTTGFTCGRWWMPAYLNAWADLMRKLAVLLDDDPQCREIASHPASTHYAEPYQRGTNPMENAITGHPNFGKSNIQVMFEAMAEYGGNEAAQVAKNASGAPIGPSSIDAAAMLWPYEMVTVGGKTMTRWESFGWKKTRHYLAHNPFQQWKVTNPDPANFVFSNVTDPGGWTQTSMSINGNAMGPRLILGNNSLRAPILDAGPKYPTMYAAMEASPRGTGYQTATQDIILKRYRLATTNTATITQALSAVIDIGLGITTEANDSPDTLISPPVTALHGRSIELPPGWHTTLTNSAQCRAWNERAAENPTGD